MDKIVATKWAEIAEAKRRVPLAELQTQLSAAPGVRDFLGPLSRPGSIHLIAEVKKASPSRGVIRADFDPVAIAKIYEQHGASCISVLTDETYFQGHLSFLSRIRQAVSIPLLRKDFILDEYQILEARVAGADAVLLIAECLEAEQLAGLVEATARLGMTALVEFYDRENLPKVIASGTRLCGVNNRDLRTFRTDLQHTVRLRREIPAEMIVVGESGIHSRRTPKSCKTLG